LLKNQISQFFHNFLMPFSLHFATIHNMKSLLRIIILGSLILKVSAPFLYSATTCSPELGVQLDRAVGPIGQYCNALSACSIKIVDRMLPGGAHSAPASGRSDKEEKNTPHVPSDCLIAAATAHLDKTAGKNTATHPAVFTINSTSILYSLAQIITSVSARHIAFSLLIITFIIMLPRSNIENNSFKQAVHNIVTTLLPRLAIPAGFSFC
jgi:hypothetical protein